MYYENASTPQKYKVLTLIAVILYSRLQQVPVIDFSIYCLKMT